MKSRARYEARSGRKRVRITTHHEGSATAGSARTTRDPRTNDAGKLRFGSGRGCKVPAWRALPHSGTGLPFARDMARFRPRTTD